jgi:hypothetical protein
MSANAPQAPRSEEEQLSRAVVRLNTTMFGMLLGVLFALGILIATNWLVLKGGPINNRGEEVIGPHLQLLGQFFIGYRVTFVGSLIGAAWAFALGTITGSVLGWIYNKLVDLRG